MKIQSLFLLLLWLAHVHPSLTAQSSLSADSLIAQGQRLYDKGEVIFLESDMDSAFQLYDQTLPLFEGAKAWELYVRSLNALATVSYYQNKFERYKSYAQRAVKEAERYLGKEHPKYGEALNNLGNIYYSTGNYAKCIEILKTSLDIQERNQVSKLELAYTYQNLGTNYYRAGDFSRSLDYRLQTLKIRQDSLPNNSTLLANTYREVGLVYLNLNRYADAIQYYQKGLDILKTYNPNQNIRTFRRTISIYQDLAVNHLQLDNAPKAQQYLEQALLLQKDDKSYHKEMTYDLLAKVEMKKKNYTQAIDYLLIANRLAELNYKNRSYPVRARIMLVTAQVYQLLKRPKDALDYFQKGLQTLSPGYKLPSQLDNPPIDQVLAQPVALQLLKGKASLLQQLADQKQDKQLRQTAYQTYLLATELIRQMRLGVQTADAKNALSSQSVGIYEGAIQTALQLHQDDPNPDYLRQAFRLAESNKALLLLESLNARQASGFANLPDSLREAEAALRIDLAYYQKQILEARQQKAKIDSARLRSQEQQLFKLQQEYEQLSQQMERNYPQYYQLKYQQQPIQIDQLQEQLAEQQSSLLEYFAGDSALYLFVLSPQELQVIHIQDQESIYQDVQYIRQFISRSPAAGLSADELKNYAQKAHRLYRQLIAPAQVHLPEDTKRLLIVPDYTLAYLPFELLLQQDSGPTPSSFSPDKLDYLLKNYLISNDYSAALWSRGQQQSRQDFSDSFVGFAPSFASTVQAEVRSCNENQLSSLQCNQEEIQQIQSLIGGRQYLAEAASKQQFGQQIEGSEVLHLATHACVDEDSPMLSKIFLSDDYLSIFDLYNIRLQSELVVLSACNTGSGKLIKGEGVLSLARGFITAGCASTVMSLWSVDDCATSEIMAAFYRQLKEGKPKDAALQQAKLDFLAGSSKAKQHPFYWAAFVQYGNSRPLGHSQGGLNWLVLAGLLLMGLSLGILVTNLRKKKAQQPT